jgi:double-GTPase-like protein
VTDSAQNVARGVCSKADCTAAATGKCLDSYESLTDCPNFAIATPTVSVESNESTLTDDPVVSAEHGEISGIGRKFHPGTELGIEDAAAVMRSRYSHLLGIVGQTDAGKTAFLSALYLMSAQALLKPHYYFAGSLTLQGFEDRVRRVRRWDNSGLEKKFMVHTQLLNPRSPSFMHLSLKEGGAARRRVELLMTDLPGEWTSDLINRLETASRFKFMRRADAVVYVLDGPLLADVNSQYQESHKARLMLERLRNIPLVTMDTPLVLLITKCDEIGMTAPSALTEIVEQAKVLGFEPEVILSSCFSRNPKEVEPGTGVKGVIDFVLQTRPPIRLEEAVDQGVKQRRAFARFRQR